MDKIIAAFDSQHLSQGVMSYLQMLSRVQPVRVTRMFLPVSEGIDLWNYGEGAFNYPVLMHAMTETETRIMEKNVETFERLLRQDIPYRIHKEFSDMALQEVIQESRFADLMVIGDEVFYEGEDGDGINERLKDVLFRSECPVLLVPEKFGFPGSNIIAYDGTPSSAFAIKQFMYLFPEWCKNPTWVLYASEEGNGVPYETCLRELTWGRFPDITFYHLPINPRKYFATWVSEKEGALLVCGAFGRSVISENIRKSFVSDAVNDHKLPIFTAHR